MKTDRFLSLAVGIAFFTWAFSVSPLFSQVPFNRVILVDNFDQGVRVNLLEGKTGGDEELPGGCVPSFAGQAASVFGARGRSLQLDYDVVTPGSFSYYWTTLGPASADEKTATPLDLREFRYLSFWIRSDQRIAQFAVEIHEDTDGDGLFKLGKDVSSRVQSLAYVPAPKMAGWQKVVIPLDRFRQIQMWTRILEVAFVFENKFGAQKGTIYIDDLLFGSYLPEGKGSAIPEAFELKSFQFNNAELTHNPVTLQEENRVAIALVGVPLSLERLHLDVSWDGGATWETIQNFYDHSAGGNYEFQWTASEKKGEQVQLRLGATSSLGRETLFYPLPSSEGS